MQNTEISTAHFLWAKRKDVVIYRSVGNRLAVDFSNLGLPIEVGECLEILESKGFKVINVNFIEEARKYVGKAKYKRGARLEQAPNIFDCSSLIKWLFGQIGVWVPRRSIQQYQVGDKKLSNNLCGHLYFIRGINPYYELDKKDGIGHVGISTGESTIIHASGTKRGVVEDPIEVFLDDRYFKGIRRILPFSFEKFFVFETPEDREVETSDDVKWIIYQNI